MHLVALIISAVLLSGCGRSEDLRPAPSSSVAKDFAAIDAASWMLRDANNRSFTTVMPTGSMVPTLDSRSVLLLERVSGPELKVGDIAIYAGTGARKPMVVHRVTAIGASATLFAGDNNDPQKPDGWIAHDRIRWRVAGILFTKR